MLSSGDEDEENSTSQRVDPSKRLDATYKVQRRFRQDYNAGINWKPFEGWTFRSEFGYGWRYYNTDQVYEELAARYNTKIGYTTAPQAQFTTKDYRNWRNANTITYDNKKLFGKRDHLNVMIGQEWSSSNEVDRVHTSVNFPSSLTVDEILANTAIGTALPNESDIKADDNMLSFFGRINYTMMQKYLLTVTVRADGSSKFGEGHRWGAFPPLLPSLGVSPTRNGCRAQPAGSPTSSFVSPMVLPVTTASPRASSRPPIRWLATAASTPASTRPTPP